MSELVYVFLIKRPTDAEAWPTVWRDHERADKAPYRASDVHQITLIEKDPVNTREKSP